MPGVVDTKVGGSAQSIKPQTTLCEVGSTHVSGEQRKGVPSGWAPADEKGENAFLPGCPSPGTGPTLRPTELTITAAGHGCCKRPHVPAGERRLVTLLPWSHENHRHIHVQLLLTPNDRGTPVRTRLTAGFVHEPPGFRSVRVGRWGPEHELNTVLS